MIDRDSSFSEIKSELIKRYLYLYNNRKLILSLCIGKKSDMESIGQYYLFKDIDKEIVNAFFDFLFSDNDMENSVLYNQIELIKGNSEYLYMYNYLILMLERKNGNSVFTVWKILSYVREKCKGNDIFLSALDRYYNIDRYVISGKDCASGYMLSVDDFNNMIDDYYKKYPSDMHVIDFDDNELEMVDEYFNVDNGYKCNNGYSTSKFMSALVNGSMLDIENKNKILKRINNIIK